MKEALSEIISQNAKSEHLKNHKNQNMDFQVKPKSNLFFGSGNEAI